MPAWDKSAFDKFYISGAERHGHPNIRPQIKLHYHWYPILQWQASFAPRLFNVLGLVSGQSVTIVGAGFNGTGAGLKRLGIDVIGTDISAYINAEKTNTEEAEVRAECITAGVDPDVDTIIGPPGNVRINPLDLFLDGGRSAPKVREQATVVEEDLSTKRSRNSVDRSLPTRARYCISEEVLNGGTDAEALTVCQRMAQYVSEKGGTVVHMLSPLLAKGPGAPEMNWKTYADWRAFLDADGFSAQLILPTVTSWDQGETPLSVDSPNRTNKVVAYSGVF